MHRGNVLGRMVCCHLMFVSPWINRELAKPHFTTYIASSNLKLPNTWVQANKIRTKSRDTKPLNAPRFSWYLVNFLTRELSLGYGTLELTKKVWGLNCNKTYWCDGKTVPKLIENTFLALSHYTCSVYWAKWAFNKGSWLSSSIDLNFIVYLLELQD